MKTFSWLLLALFLVGCATSSDRQFSLNQTLLGYEKAYRWGEFGSLLSFRKNSDEKDMDIIRRYDDLRISGYQAKRSLPSDDNRQLLVDVEISYFQTNDNRIKTVLDKQRWEYDDDAKRWYIISPLPNMP